MRVQPKHRRNRPVPVQQTRRSSGFTLVELMVVIVIIALLVGLVMPAIFSAITAARNAEVRSEITQLAEGISSFKSKYGMEPPSNISFPTADALEWNTPALARSRAIIRRIWPSFDFSTNGGDTSDGTLDLKGTLNGAECLVFFLGGLQDSNGALVGFSENPSRPFVLGGNRVGPFFQFDIARLTPTGSGTSGNEDAPEYKDPLPSQTSPYFYFSSYDGKGYRLAEVGGPALPLRHYVMNDNGTPTDLTDDPPFNPNTYQIVSPGADGKFGDASATADDFKYAGGVYDPDDESTVGEDERDNITNFTSGRLVP